MNNKNQIAIVGMWEWEQYEEAFSNGLKANGVEVLKIDIKNFFSGYWGRVFKNIPIPTYSVVRLNIEIINKLRKYRPHVVLFWRPIHIFPITIKIAKILQIKTVTYNNDDPFSQARIKNAKLFSKYSWFWYKRCIIKSDYNFFYRKTNCEEAMNYGAKHADVMFPYFMPWRDKPIALREDEKKKYEADVVFVGHYEPDGREVYIRKMLDYGIDLKIWGGSYWSKEVLGAYYDHLYPIKPALNDDYAKALAGGKICICFLSKLNRDTYTRRCFEIPACGQLLLSERTDDLMKIFKENEEACFFSNPEELIEKIDWLLKNEQIRKEIARTGMKKVWLDGHNVESRVNQFLTAIDYNSHYI